MCQYTNGKTAKQFSPPNQDLLPTPMINHKNVHKAEMKSHKHITCFYGNMNASKVELSMELFTVPIMFICVWIQEKKTSTHTISRHTFHHHRIATH